MSNKFCMSNKFNITYLDSIIKITHYSSRLLNVCWKLYFTDDLTEESFIKFQRIFISSVLIFITFSVFGVMSSIASKTIMCNGFLSDKNLHTSRSSILILIGYIIDLIINIVFITHILIDMIYLDTRELQQEAYNKYTTILSLVNILWGAMVVALSVISNSVICKKIDKRKNADNIPYEYTYQIIIKSI